MFITLSVTQYKLFIFVIILVGEKNNKFVINILFSESSISAMDNIFL